MEAILIYMAILIILGYIGHRIEKRFPKYHKIIFGSQSKQSDMDEQEQNAELWKPLWEPLDSRGYWEKYYDARGHFDSCVPHNPDIQPELANKEQKDGSKLFPL